MTINKDYNEKDIEYCLDRQKSVMSLLYEVVIEMYVPGTAVRPLKGYPSIGLKDQVISFRF